MNLEIAPGNYGGSEVHVQPRGSDWGLGGFKKYLHHVREAVRVLRAARRYDALAVFSVSGEAFLIGALRRFFCRKTRIVCADFLIPRPSRLLRLLAGGLKRIDAFVCIRSGDAETLRRRFGVPLSRCSFAAFPASRSAFSAPASEGGYIYSGGWAHRDWPTLLDALGQVENEAILSVGGELDLPKALRRRVKALPQRSPEEGRRLMARATLVVLPLADTELPCGPIVLLDALAMGKAVIVTNVNGSRDYVVHGKTAILTPPGDSAALAAAIRDLMGNPSLRHKLGAAAREDAARRFTAEAFVSKILEACSPGSKTAHFTGGSAISAANNV